MENRGSKCVRRGRRFGNNPGSSCIGGVKEFLRVGDKVCSVGRVFVMIESQKTKISFLEAELSPCVTFVAGHPHREVFEPDEDGLREDNLEFNFKLLLEFDKTANYLPFLEVAVLNNLGWELKLEKYHN
jgi:hypothetical protein